MAKPFASSADVAAKTETLEVLDDGVYALTAEGDPNVGAFEGEDFIVAVEARATPAAARDWLAKLREHTKKPVKYLVLTHYHAVRVLGASAFDAEHIITSETTRKLIEERGQQDWDSEYGRMPRLFKEPEGIPGLTWPTQTFETRHEIDLGGNRGKLELEFNGRGHTAGDIIVWHDKTKTMFAGDLVEAEAALYTGDAHHFEWATGTLDKLKQYRAQKLVGGRGAVARGEAAMARAPRQEEHRREARDAVVLALDEVANIAPLPQLPRLVSSGSGQGIQIMAVLQDLSQARARWHDQADGFLTLFQHKVLLPGVMHAATLEAISKCLPHLSAQHQPIPEFHPSALAALRRHSPDRPGEALWVNGADPERLNIYTIYDALAARGK